MARRAWLSLEERGLWLVLIVGALLSALYIGSKSFWIDEGATVWITSLDFGDFVSALWEAEANGTLYYLLLRFWRTLGDSEAYIRSLSAIFALGTVPLLYAIVRRTRGSAVALVACALFVTNSFWVHYAQEARSYSLAMFLVTLGTYILMRASEGPSAKRWFLYGVVMSLALYAHFYAAFILIAHALWLIIGREERLSLRQATIGFALPVVAGLPLAAFVLVNDNGQVDWLERPGWSLLARCVTEITGGIWSLPLYLALVVVAAFVWVRRPKGAGGEGSEGSGERLLWLWLLVPIVLGFLFSQIKPLFYPRFLLVSLPALCGVVAFGVAALRPVVLRSAIAVGLLVTTAIGVAGWYSEKEQPWSEITATIADRDRPGDIIVMAPYARRPVEYYVEREGLEDSFPTPVWPEGEWGSHPTVLPPFEYDGIPEVSAAAADAPRVWFATVIPRDPANLARMEALGPACRKTFGTAGGKLKLFTCQGEASR